MAGWHLEQSAPSLTALRVIHLGLVTGLVPLAAVAGFLGPDVAADRGHSLGVLALVAIVLVVLSIFSALFLQTTIARRVATKRDEALEQLEAGLVRDEVSAACMVAWGIIEGAGLFGGVVALVTGITWALAAPIVAFVALAAMRPTEAGLRSLVESV
ncbi:MAG: hypothetical protein VXZ39_10050 [Planctomycetota bacterium]|nr:hypothetical protein [Planctomycetota bacterium]MEC8495256.1 hypothetical protein [Planctomycetota bacterium]MEC8511489.1 hypothetical protein [Planctomycetota bacterium]